MLKYEKKGGEHACSWKGSRGQIADQGERSLLFVGLAENEKLTPSYRGNPPRGILAGERTVPLAKARRKREERSIIDAGRAKARVELSTLIPVKTTLSGGRA